MYHCNWLTPSFVDTWYRKSGRNVHKPSPLSQDCWGIHKLYSQQVHNRYRTTEVHVVWWSWKVWISGFFTCFNASKWNNKSKCRECKHNLATHFALHMLKLVPQYLTHGKQFTVVGSLRGSICDKALFNEHGCEIQNWWPSHMQRKKGTCRYGSTANTLCMGVRKIVFSPDTDRYCGHWVARGWPSMAFMLSWVV